MIFYLGKDKKLRVRCSRCHRDVGPLKSNPYSPSAAFTHHRVRDPRLFDRMSFRTIPVGTHDDMLVVGCPKGRYKQGRCQVGMIVQSVLKPKLRSNPKSFNEYLGVDEQPIIKNLVRKKEKGTYQHALAVKLWRYHADRGAQKYAKDFGSSGQKWYKMFNTETRNKVAEDFADHFETEYDLGNYK